jgi:chromosome segregation ATPase
MTDDEDGSITPENRIKQLEERLVEESDRLEKLYVAYRKVEQELEEKNAIIDVLEKEAIDKEIEREGMETLLGDKDRRIHDMEMDGAKSSTKIKHLEPKLEKTEEMYTREKARLGRVFEVAEELDEALQTAQVELTARDDWYVQHMKLFENLNQAIQTRYEMIDSAIEKSAEFAKKQDTFKSRMDEALDAAEEAVAHAQDMSEELSDESED